jgi:hypothetical protein
MTQRDARLSVPRSPEELTREWLSSALSGRYAGVEVVSLYQGTIIHGSATKIRLLVEYNEVGQSCRLPPTMWAKAGFEAHSSSLSESYRSEVLFYLQRAPERLANHPECYFAAADRSSRASILMLEDLLGRNVRFGSADRPIAPAIAYRAIDMLARYHARWWNSAELALLGPAGGAIIADDWVAFQMAEENFNRSMMLPRAHLVPRQLRNRKRLERALNKMWEYNTLPPGCLLHADLHLGNTFLEPDGKPGFIDWQGTTWGCWAHDFTEFVLTSLSIEDRRASDQDLLKYYLQQLGHYGVSPPEFDEAWVQYRRNAAWVAFASATCPPTLQPEAVCTLYTQRGMAAVEDLDTLSCLEE